MARQFSRSIGSAGVPLDRQAAELIRRLEAIKQREVPLAFASGINRTARLARTQIARAIAKNVGVPYAATRERFYMKEATADNLVALVRNYTRGVNMMKVRPRDTGRWKKGVRGRVGRGVRARGGHHIPDGFIAKDPRGRLQTWEHIFRKDGSGGVGVVRVPIEQEVKQLAPTVIAELSQSRLPDLIVRDLQYRLGKLEARA